jgi:hypothetical protein
VVVGEEDKGVRWKIGLWLQEMNINVLLMLYGVYTLCYIVISRSMYKVQLCFAK